MSLFDENKVIADGCLVNGSPEAAKYGMNLDLFSGDSYLWENPDSIWISNIFSNKPGEGNFSKLVNNILGAGKICIVPTPLGKMPAILKHLGFKPYQDPEDGCLLLVKEPKGTSTQKD